MPKGKRTAVSLSFKVDDLGFWDVNTGENTVYGGLYEIQVGSSSADIRRVTEIYIAAPEFEGVDVTKPIPAALSCDYLGVTYLTDKSLNEYALIDDWQSYISYEGCHMTGKRNLEIIAANPGTQAKLTVTCAETGELIAEAVVPPTGAFDAFVTVKAEAKPISGICTLRFTVDNTLALNSFRFF